MLPPVLSIRNGRRSVVITGTPEQLARFELYCQQIADAEAADRKNKVRGGAVFCAGVRPGAASRSVSTALGCPTASIWSARGPNKVGLDVSAGARDDRGDPGASGRLGGRDHQAARGRGPLDPRPGPG